MTNSDPHDGLLAIDTHVDIPWPEGPSPYEDGPRCVDFPKLHAGRIAAVCFAAYIPQGQRDAVGHDAAATRVRGMLDVITAMGEGGVVATTADAIEAAFAAGQKAVIPAIENGYAMGKNLSALDEFAARGVRYITLTHNGHNELADAAIPLRSLHNAAAEHGGLSALGRAAVQRMNELGILVDVSHAAKSTMMQATEVSRTPVVATHSCIRALCDHPRNLDDAQLDRLAETGGVVQITAMPYFLRREGRVADVGIPALIDHIDYAVQRIGLDHVGISSDFDGGGGIAGWTNAAETEAVTSALRARGYPPEQIAALWGGNFLRLLRQAEEVAGWT